ncbi:hypothetical protein [Microbacterium hatanonis]|uniref:hypothetical protein n=1 Tax=Microbacterium hatanonis TaxID=404366 RepID=UPI0024827578|nr:hypothetical protein [Microbacterium hatanonis]
MGHSDAVVVADAHFPTPALASRLVKLPGTRGARGSRRDPQRHPARRRSRARSDGLRRRRGAGRAA